MEQSPPLPPPDPLAEARRLLAEDEQARTQACIEEIHAVLAKHSMRLDVTPARIVLTPQPRTETP